VRNAGMTERQHEVEKRIDSLDGREARIALYYLLYSPHATPAGVDAAIQAALEIGPLGRLPDISLLAQLGKLREMPEQ
jgi:hypothetical protein